MHLRKCFSARFANDPIAAAHGHPARERPSDPVETVVLRWSKERALPAEDRFVVTLNISNRAVVRVLHVLADAVTGAAFPQYALRK